MINRLRDLADDIGGLSTSFRCRAERPRGLSATRLLGLVEAPVDDPASRFLYTCDEVVATEPESMFPREEVMAGERAIADGRVAVVVLAGGLGVSDLITTPVPRIGTSVLAWHLMQIGAMPAWVMASARDAGAVREHIGALTLPPGMVGCVFDQFENYLLTPDDRLAFDVDGSPMLGDGGNGDLGPALLESGIIDDNPDVRYVYVYNATNVFASPHPGIIGRHLGARVPVTVEVVERRDNDQKVGIVASVDGVPQVVESFRTGPGNFLDCRFLSTNSMVIDVDVLREEGFDWRWHRRMRLRNKRVTFGYERLLQQYTEMFPAQFIHVDRMRYLPIRSSAELAAVGSTLSTYRFV